MLFGHGLSAADDFVVDPAGDLADFPTQPIRPCASAPIRGYRLDGECVRELIAAGSLRCFGLHEESVGHDMADASYPARDSGFVIWTRSETGLFTT